MRRWVHAHARAFAAFCHCIYFFQMQMPCMMCKKRVSSPRNVHFDHIDPTLKKLHIAKLITHHSACHAKPNSTAFVPGEDVDQFESVYDAFFSELPNLAVLCAICHALKTFAEFELHFLLRNAENSEDSDSDFSHSERSNPKAPKSRRAAASNIVKIDAPASLSRRKQAARPTPAKPTASKRIPQAAAGQKKPTQGVAKSRK